MNRIKKLLILIQLTFIHFRQEPLVYVILDALTIRIHHTR